MELTQLAESVLKPLVSWLSSVLFYSVGGFPLIVLWLMVAALFFTLYLRGVNVRLLGHSFKLITERSTAQQGEGEISQLQAFLSAISATVGLGSIAGVSVAVAVGGPGAIFWIVVMGLFAMATKFAEVTLSLLYRKIDADGKIEGGPIQYLHEGLKELGYARLGRILATVFAIFCLGGAIGGGNMFQSNQTVKILVSEIPTMAQHGWVISAAFALLVGLVLFGSIKRIARVAEAVGPMKGLVYLACAIIIVGYNIEQLPHALWLILHDAFTAEAAKGGMLGMLVMAFKRALFANEAGLGSAPIAHAAARVEDPAREGSIALIEPLFAAFIALLTGLMVVTTGAYQGASIEDGVLIASTAFATVGSWFTIMLAVCVFLFAYGTTIGWSYYGEIAWNHLFGRRSIKLYYVLYTFACFVGGIATFGVIMDLADLLILGCALPNIAALFLLRHKIRAEMVRYMGMIGAKG
ncbi:MAG: alanine/glycine:cation symporter family protein [Rickettsiales bacterium]